MSNGTTRKGFDTMEQIELFGVTVCNTQELYTLFFRFFLNLLFAFIVIKGIYHRINKRNEYLFTFFVFNVLIFFVSSLLSSIKLKTGFAFGLFAVFSILRYRTRQIDIKEMTFLFASIIIAVINSLVTSKVGLFEILFANISIVLAIFILESIWLKGFSASIPIIYENIDLVHANKREEMARDIQKRTGLPVKSFEIVKINLLRDTAEILVYYDDQV